MKQLLVCITIQYVSVYMLYFKNKHYCYILSVIYL